MDLDPFPDHVSLQAGDAWICRSRSPDDAVRKGGEHLNRAAHAGGRGADVAAGPTAQAEAVYSDVGGGSLQVEGVIDGGLDVCRVEVGEGGEGDAVVAGHDEPPEVHGRHGQLDRVGLRGLLSLDRGPLLRRGGG